MCPFKQRILLKCVPSNILVFESTVPPLDNKFDSDVPPLLAYDTNVPPLNDKFDSNVPPQNTTRLICRTEVSFAATAFKILIYSWFTHFCREFSFVAITRFLGGTFGQNLVGGGTKTFYRTGGWWTGGEAPRMMHREWCTENDAPRMMHWEWCTENDAPRMIQQGWCTGGGAPRVMHRSWCTENDALELMHQGWCTEGDAPGVMQGGWCTEVDARRMMHWSWCTGDDAP